MHKYMQIKQTDFKTSSEQIVHYTINHILVSEMMVHYFSSPADKYGGYQPSLATATSVSGTARFGTTLLRADKPRKTDGNPQMLERENQLNNYSTWNIYMSYKGNTNVQQTFVSKNRT